MAITAAVTAAITAAVAAVITTVLADTATPHECERVLVASPAPGADTATPHECERVLVASPAPGAPRPPYAAAVTTAVAAVITIAISAAVTAAVAVYIRNLGSWHPFGKLTEVECCSVEAVERKGPGMDVKAYGSGHGSAT